MKMLRTYSGKVITLLFFIFAVSFGQKIIKVFSEDKNCLSLHDGFGYYMYLPQLFQHGNLKMDKEWVQEVQNEYCDGAFVYQLIEYQDRNAIPANQVDIYHMGLSFLMLPAYTVAEIVAHIGGYKNNGFTTPYQVAYYLNALLFIFLGLLYLRKLLRLFVDDKIAGLTIGLVYLGTNALITFSAQYDLPHLYLFSLNAVVLYHLFNYSLRGNRKAIWYAAIVFGLTVCIRPTQALFGMIPFVVLLSRDRISWLFVRNIVLFPLFAFLWNVPQFVYWKMVGGDWLIPNLHSEDIVLSDPNLLDFLFSYKKGWLLYTPLFLLLPFSWMKSFREHRSLIWGISIFTLVYIYVMSSWECWWYASSFSSRVMVDIYPVLTIVLALLLVSVQRERWQKWSVGSFVVACVLLNLIQSWQVEKGMLHTERMTKQHYWEIFGKLTIKGYQDNFLEIAIGDLNWPERFRTDTYEGGVKVVSENVYQSNTPFTVEPEKGFSVGDFELKNFVRSQENMIEVIIKSQTSDSLASCGLYLHAVGQRENAYSWDSFELSLGRKTNVVNTDTLRFNLPRIRNKEDDLHVYFYKPNASQLNVSEMKIKSYSLLRD